MSGPIECWDEYEFINEVSTSLGIVSDRNRHNLGSKKTRHELTPDGKLLLAFDGQTSRYVRALWLQKPEGPILETSLVPCILCLRHGQKRTPRMFPLDYFLDFL